MSDTPHPTLSTHGRHGRAIDQAVELLGALLRSEAEDAASRRAEVLRGRLEGSSRSALRARVSEPEAAPNH